LKDFDLYPQELADKKLVRGVLLDALAEGDLESFREVLRAHLNTVSKLALARTTGLGRRTIYDLLDSSKSFDPRLSTVAALFKDLAA